MNNRALYKDIQITDQKECETLLNDIQNIIWALHFEIGPQPRGSIDNFSLLFFALIEQAMLEPLPWQKITVNEGPKSQAMYEVLKAAISAVKELNPNILNEAKEKYAGHYDCVKTLLGGKLSISKGGYIDFANFMGTIKNQPGYYVNKVLVQTDHLLRNLCGKYSIDSKQCVRKGFNI